MTLKYEKLNLVHYGEYTYAYLVYRVPNGQSQPSRAVSQILPRIVANVDKGIVHVTTQVLIVTHVYKYNIINQMMRSKRRYFFGH